MKYTLLILLVTLASCGTPRATDAPRPTRAASPTRTPAPRQPTAVPRGYMSRALLGDKWPLTVDEGTIVCDRNAILFRDADGHLYAVNGAAITLAESKGWRDIHDIDVPVPDGSPGAIISLQPLLDTGLALCPQR